MAARLIKTPHEVLQEKLLDICHTLLEEKFLLISIEDLLIKEFSSIASTHVSCKLNVGKSTYQIKDYGDGFIDALYSGIKNKLSEKYSSLDSVRLIDFAIDAYFEKSNKKNSNMDAKVEVTLLIESGDDRRFVFRAKSCSLIRASALAVVQVLEYFINSEEAVGLLHVLIKDAKKRNRGDILERYLYYMSELVKNVSYENKIKKLLLEVHMNCEKNEKLQD